AHADLPHLDARLVLARQVLDQLAEIDALLGEEVEDDALAAEEVLDVHQLHLQAALLHEALAGLQLALLQLVQAPALRAVAVADGPDDAPLGRLAEQLGGARRGGAEDGAQLVAALR